MKIAVLIIICLHLASSFIKKYEKRGNGKIKEKIDNIDLNLKPWFIVRDYFLVPIAIICAILYTIYPDSSYWLNIDFPQWLNMLGLLVGIFSTALKIWSYRKLKGNWSGGIALYENQKLITDGPYGLIRHPIYLSYFLLTISIFLAWESTTFLFIGIICLCLVVSLRTYVEEKALAIKFKTEHFNYRKKVGMFVPLFIQKTTIKLAILISLIGILDNLIYHLTNCSLIVALIT